jgi:hypothetical protein
MDNLKFDSEKHEYRLDGRLVPCVSDFLKPYMDFSKINKQILEDKQAFGKTVHSYLEAYDKNELDMDNLPIDETGETDIKAIILAWKEFFEPFKFRADSPEMIAIEKPLYSDNYRFAGTPDRILFQSNTIIEIKTSAPRKTTGVQLAFYAILAIHNLLVCRPSVNGQIEDPKLISFHVDEHGKWKSMNYDYRECRNQALCLITNYNYFKE